LLNLWFTLYVYIYIPYIIYIIGPVICIYVYTYIIYIKYIYMMVYYYCILIKYTSVVFMRSRFLFSAAGRSIARMFFATRMVWVQRSFREESVADFYKYSIPYIYNTFI
jgi:hypothetical protein